MEFAAVVIASTVSLKTIPFLEVPLSQEALAYAHYDLEQQPILKKKNLLIEIPNLLN